MWQSIGFFDPAVALSCLPGLFFCALMLAIAYNYPFALYHQKSGHGRGVKAHRGARKRLKASVGQEPNPCQGKERGDFIALLWYYEA